MTNTDTMSHPCSIADRHEHKIAAALVDAILAAEPFHHIAVYDGEEFVMGCATRDVAAIMAALASTDADRLYIYAHPCSVVSGYAAMGYIVLIYGNGQDLISDWYPGSDASWLSKLLAPVLGTLDDEPLQGLDCVSAGAVRKR